MKKLSAVVLLVSLNIYAQDVPQQRIGEVTLFGEQGLKVEAATKTETPISNAPSAVTVISAKQIRESGARTVPDLLRLLTSIVRPCPTPRGPSIPLDHAIALGFQFSPKRMALSVVVHHVARR